MSKEFLDTAVSYGIFGALFIWLLWNTMKENKAREDRYIETIKDLTQALQGANEVRIDIEDIKNDIKDIKEKI